MSFHRMNTVITFSLWALASTASAQNTDLASASTSTCNLKGSVTITLAGVPTTTPLPCVNHSERTSPGQDVESITGPIVAGVPLVLTVAGLSAPRGEADYVIHPNESLLAGVTSLDEISLVQSIVSASNVQGALVCDSKTGNATMKCGAGTQIAQLRVSGQTVALPSVIPLNYVVQSLNTNVQIGVLGLPVQIPVTGSLMLNKISVTGSNTAHLAVAHSPVSLHLQGAANVLGIGLVGLNVDVDDYSYVDLLGNDPIVQVILPCPLVELTDFLSQSTGGTGGTGDLPICISTI